MHNDFKITTFIFDLDGTLLPMDQEEFLNYYFIKLTSKFSKVDPKLLVNAIKYSVKAMLENSGSKTNETVFWETFRQVFPVDDNTNQEFLNFYTNEFQELQKLTPQDEAVPEIIKILKSKNYRLICCTNPVFPQIATYSRMRWAGLQVEDFQEITTYENSHFCKPNLNYYQEVLKRLNLTGNECIMVGNDVEEDLCVKELGMKTFLVTNHIINSKNQAIITDYQGTRIDLLNFVKEIKPIK